MELSSHRYVVTIFILMSVLLITPNCSDHRLEPIQPFPNNIEIERGAVGHFDCSQYYNLDPSNYEIRWKMNDQAAQSISGIRAREAIIDIELYGNAKDCTLKIGVASNGSRISWNVVRIHCVYPSTLAKNQ